MSSREAPVESSSPPQRFGCFPPTVSPTMDDTNCGCGTPCVWRFLQPLRPLPRPHTVIDTVLLCVLVDETANDGAGRPYFMTSDLLGLTRRHNMLAPQGAAVCHWA